MIYIKYVDYWIWTADLWYQKQPLHQLSLNHCPKQIILIAFRWLFNWSHWFVGNSAWTLAIAAIFLSVDLSAPKLPKTMSDAMIAYVVIHAIVHLVTKPFLTNRSGTRDLDNQI